MFKEEGKGSSSSSSRPEDPFNESDIDKILSRDFAVAAATDSSSSSSASSSSSSSSIRSTFAKATFVPSSEGEAPLSHSLFLLFHPSLLFCSLLLAAFLFFVFLFLSHRSFFCPLALLFRCCSPFSITFLCVTSSLSHFSSCFFSFCLGVFYS